MMSMPLSPAAPESGLSASVLAKLHRLEEARGARGETMVLRPFGGRSLVATVLGAIDETVLPQSLRVENDRGDVLVLAAANRRLVRVERSAGPRRAGSDDGLETLFETVDETCIAPVAEALSRFALGNDRLTLSLAPRDVRDRSGTPGVAVRTLLEHLGQVAEAPQTSDTDGVLGRILGDLQSAYPDGLEAFLFAAPDGEIADKGGPEIEALEALYTDVAAAEADLSSGRSGGATPQRVMSFVPKGQGGRSALFVMRDEGAIALFVPRAQAAQIVGRLQEGLHAALNPT